MSLKVFQLAKELGIDSKAIVKKLDDEGIPSPDPKKPSWTHMSPVSAGLAESVREWFASSTLKTAIESTQHVEAVKIQKAPRKRGSKKAGGNESGGDEGDTATAVAEAPYDEGSEQLESPAEEVESAKSENEEAVVAEQVVEAAPVEEAAPVAEVPPVQAAPVLEAPVTLVEAPVKLERSNT